jgi:hypothetical protein
MISAAADQHSHPQARLETNVRVVIDQNNAVDRQRAPLAIMPDDSIAIGYNVHGESPVPLGK